MTVYAELSGGAVPLAPGRFVRGTVDAGDAAPRQAIPRRAVRGDRVYVVRDGRVQQREVKPAFNLAGSIEELGLPDTAWVVLAEPLPEGDLVVLDGSRSLPVGAPALAVGSDGNALRAEAIERRPPLRAEERVP
ncbi:MAG: hypothetical protein KC591_17905, partial [Gemmatimonadetes bacterium]|nr:hypothetical protein [Gemmatimonadota bacterium]